MSSVGVGARLGVQAVDALDTPSDRNPEVFVLNHLSKRQS